MIQVPRTLLALLILSLLLGNAKVVADSFANAHFARARALYEANNFDAYFGTARWLRGLHWDKLTFPERDQWTALELLALARHCRWPEIKRFAESTADLGRLSQDTLSMIRVKTEYGKFESDPKPLRQTLQTSALQKQSRWKLEQSEFTRLASPDNVRVHVESRCE